MIAGFYSLIPVNPAEILSLSLHLAKIPVRKDAFLVPDESSFFLYNKSQEIFPKIPIAITHRRLIWDVVQKKNIRITGVWVP